MAMLHQVSTRDNTIAQVLPNTEPTDTAYTNWKAKNYTPATANRAYYNFGQMWKYHKILKRNSKLGATAMAA
jgi:hypothetical protein